MSDLIVKGAGEIKDGLYNIKDGKLFQYKANGGTVRTYQIVSADRPKWIPLNAKGREPEDNGEYLLQLSDGFITVTYYDGKDWELWANSGEPVAWMELPEAYREDGEEE